MRAILAWRGAALRLTGVALATTLCAATVPRTALYAQGSTPSYEPVGLRPDRAYFGQLPFESIDMVNGNVVLTFTDLVLPGNAGMDLRLTRTYNHQAGGRTWEFGFAGVPLRITRPDGVPDEPEYPALVMADGTSLRTFPVNSVYNDTVFVTDQFWRYTSTTRTLEMPNGWTATYEPGNPSGGVMLVEVHDAYGNAITPDWEGGDPEDIRPLRLESVTQSLSATQTRVVTFAYDPWSSPSGYMPKKMTFLEREWVYGYEYADPETQSGQRLTSVTPPVGRGWVYSYVNGLDGSVTVTTPTKGTVLYDFDDVILPAYEGVHRSVIARRVTGGRDVPAGEWTFAFDQPLQSVGVVTTPDGREVEYRHGWAPLAGRWVLDSKTLRDDHGTDVARVDRDYRLLGLSEQLPGNVVPVIEQETITQDGRSYSTTYTYSETNLGDYHQPETITESSRLTRVTTRTYDYAFDVYALNRLASETVQVGTQSFSASYGYEDATGFLDEQIVYGVRTAFGRDARGNRNRATDASDHDTGFTYDWGVLKNTVTEKYTIARTINADGTVETETRNNATTRFAYTAGRLDRVDPPTGADTVTTYDDTDGGWVKVARGATPETTAFTITRVDGFGRPRGTENAVGVYTEVRYDPDGRKVFESLPFASGSAPLGDSLAYDALGRLRQITHADDSTITYAFTRDDPDTGDLVTITDEEGHATVQTWERFGSPSEGRLVAVKDARNETWAYEYNAVGSLTKVRQPGGLERTWSYNGTTNRLESETHPESGTTTYNEYFACGPLKKKTDARTQVFTYSYDENDRLTGIDSATDAHDLAIEAYDDWDHRTRVRVGPVSDPRIVTTYGYEDATRLTSRTDTLNGRTFAVTYRYDARDNLDQMTYPSGRRVQNGYDTGNRITQVTGPDNTPVWAHTFSYHVSGGLAGYTARNGTTTTIQYEEGPATRKRHWPESVTSGPLSVGYGYDRAGNVTSITDAREGHAQGFGYDALDRLETVTEFGASSFTYDARGNRATKTGVSYTYDSGTDRLTSDGVTSFGYDAAGNLTSAGSTTYTYTPAHQLETATVDGATTTYRYDGEQQRRMRSGPQGTEYFVPGPGLVPLAEYREADGQAVLVREYLYAGTRLIASVAPVTGGPPAYTFTDDPVVAGIQAKVVHLTELRTAVNTARGVFSLPAVTTWTDPNVTTSTPIKAVHVTELRSALEAAYAAANVTPPTYTDPTLTAGMPVRAVHVQQLRNAVRDLPSPSGTDVSYYHLDALGSVRAVTDAAGAAVRRHDYQPFGEEIAPQAGADTRRFTGQERDIETGLDYFGARYYASRTGRFTTVDPGHVAGNIFDPQSWNAYAYARNNPLRFVDPTGTEYEINWLNDGQWSRSIASDAAWQDVLSNPGSGFEIQGNNILAFVNGRWVIAGYFSYLGPDQPRTFGAMVQLAGDTAAQRVKNDVTEMGINAALGIAFGFARWGVEAGVTALEMRAARMAGAAANGNQMAGVLKMIEAGTTKGRVFENRNGLLPLRPNGYYREYTVPLTAQSGRGQARLITGRGGEIFYSADHYVTVIRVR